MKIQILGSGCPRCNMLEASVREAVKKINSQAEIVKISDMDEILNMGVMMTPAIAIDGVKKSSGTVLTPDQVIELIRAAE